MLLKHVKSYIINELKIKIIIVLAVISSFIMSCLYYQSSVDTQATLKEQFKKAQENVLSIHKNVEQSAANLEIWNKNIKGIIGERVGLRIKDAKTIIEKLKQTNQINGINISLSNPEVRTNFKTPKYTNIVYSNVSISFQCLTDLEGVKFIYYLMHDLPGYVQIKELKINVDKEVESLLNSNVLTSKIGDLVKMQVEFLWQDYEDITNRKSSNLAQQATIGLKQ